MPDLYNKAVLAAALLLPLAASSAGAAPASDGPALYAGVAELRVSGKEAVAQLRLPREVYMASRSAQLDDLRIFDRNGQPVSFALRTPRPPADNSVSVSEVAIFPVRGQSTGDSTAASLQVSTSADGKVISVKTNSGAGARPDAQLNALVLDLTGDQTAPVHALRLTPPPNIGNYTARIVVEVSTDLKRWEEAGEAPVSWLRNARQSDLVSDRIELDSAGAYRYARLTWREGAPLEFTRIEAERRSATPAARASDSMVINGVPGRFVNDIVYPAAVALPVHSVSLQFDERNVVAPAALGSYLEIPVLKKGEPARYDFEPHLRATFYRLAQGGKVRTSGEFEIDHRHVAEWVLRPVTALTPAPAMRISWEPDTILFLANGAAPYTLAVGRAGVGSVAGAIDRVAPGFGEADLARAELATLGAMRSQSVAAPSASEAQLAAAGARSRTVVLWAVLVIGVLAVALMARQLMRQMPNQATSEQPPSLSEEPPSPS